MPSIHDGHRQRMKQEFLDRPRSFPDHKLLELLLFYTNPRRDVNPLAHALMDRFGSFAGVLDALPEELERVPGMGMSSAALFKAVKEAAGRYLTNSSDVSNIINDAHDACALLRPYFFGAREERAYLLCMDGKRRCLGIREVSRGSVNSASITVRRVMEAVLALNAASVILAHNHTSGIALPSAEDKLTTANLERMLSAVGVTLEDHIILTVDDAVSLRDSGWPG